MPENTQNLISWFIAILATNGVLIVGAIIGWVWQGRKNKREIKQQDFELAQKRVDALKALQNYGDTQALERLSLQEQVRVINAKLFGIECWARCMSHQLEEHGIKPYTMEEAIQRNCT